MNPEQDRCAGIFVPLFALRGTDDHGIGDTEALTEMVDWCAQHGVRVLQILPINETSGDNSPYNAVSSVALEPTTLSLKPGSVPGMTEQIYADVISRHSIAELCDGSVQYRKLEALVNDACSHALDNLSEAELGAFARYLKQEEDWISAYTEFRTLMDWNAGSPVWQEWPEPHRNRKQLAGWRDSLDPEMRERYDRSIRYFGFVQWVLHKQWKRVTDYAHERSVELMGDIPFGVSRHSADVWAQPELFDLDWSGGAPPEPLFQGDPFVKNWGQNWGVPLYRWQKMEESDYDWWKRRVRHVAQYFNLFRIDHVLGFYRLYSFPWSPERNAEFAEVSKEEVFEAVGALPRFFPESDETEEGCLVNQKHGEKLLKMILEAAGNSIVVGEDLGVVPDYVRPSLKSLGISGFKIPVFERIEENREYKPKEEYPILTVATLATHDHEPMVALWNHWWKAFEQSYSLEDSDPLKQRGIEQSWELYRTQRFVGLQDQELIRDYEPMVREAFIKSLWECPSWLSILMITDLYGLETRFNVPGPVSESNWSQRLPMTVGELTSVEPYAGISAWLQNLPSR
ncbi:MAG: 4-alpha-glucanotransferase [Verrucomicrobiota bacterium]